ncbi:MAG: hypothetical protein QXK12_04435 [Candidatus Nezhaarchaeales archaeon]
MLNECLDKYFRLLHENGHGYAKRFYLKTLNRSRCLSFFNIVLFSAFLETRFGGISDLVGL